MNTILRTIALTTCLLGLVSRSGAANTNWTWNGSVSTAWGTKANWTTTDGNAGVGANDTIIINSGATNYPILGNARTVAKFVFNGGSIDLAGDPLTVSFSTILNGGTFLNSGATDNITLSGTLRINLTGTMSIPDDISFRINGATTFVNGVLSTNSPNFIRFNDNATVTGMSNSSHIDGMVRKVGNDAFIFPTGDGTYYAPIQISAPSTTTDHFTAEYFHTAYSDLTVLTPLDNVSTYEHWILDRTNGTSNVGVTLYYSSDRSGTFSDTTGLKVARFDGADWESKGGTVNGDVNSGNVISGLVTTFSPFTLGSTSSLIPLPVELIHFAVTPKAFSKFAQIDWTTANEIGNEIYTVEKSLNGSVWTNLIEITAAGTHSSLPTAYTAVDENIDANVQYYRIRIADAEGHITYSGVAVYRSTSAAGNVLIYPNPADNIIRVDMKSETAQHVSITDPMGVTIYESHESFAQISIDISSLPPGFYIVEVTGEAGAERRRILKR